MRTRLSRPASGLRHPRKVAVSLKGFDGDTLAEQFARAYKAGRSGDWAATQWEMGQVGLQAQLENLEWRNITFYDKEGTPVPTGPELFRWDRRFKVWQYSVSHRRLLLRSDRDRPPATRIDVHVANVDLMVLRSGYEGLVIRRADDGECAKVGLDYGVEVRPGRLFALGHDLRSCVVSAPPQWHEDEGGMGDPSWFGHMRGTR